jgi:hypothetical protein
MAEQVLHRRGTTLVRPLCLAAGEAPSGIATRSIG